MSLDLDSIPEKTLVRPDGVRLAYWVIGDGPKTLLLANGLGGRLYAWEPLIRALYPEYRFITWDYRGLFRSTPPARRCHLSIVHHAGDALAILDAEGIDSAVACGWSMGVQVSLELTVLHPDRIKGLVLINGTYGHAFLSGFQPVFPLPFVGRWGHRTIEYFVDRPELTRVLKRAYSMGMRPTLALFWLVSQTPPARTRALITRYRDDIFGGDSFEHYLRLFQELDGHSVYHHLKDIQQPALVVAGLFDVLTPAYQSREMARRLPNAQSLFLKRASHFVLVERPEVVCPAIDRFLRTRVRW